MLDATTNQTEQVWAEQQKEYEALLEEKSEVIRSLYQKIQDLRDSSSGKSSYQIDEKGSDNPMVVREELKAMKKQLERERRQLREDEKTLEEQMKEMELAMSRERVELARQKNEIQRMYQDLHYELEQATRDGGLRERLMHLQQERHHDAPQHPASGFQPRRAIPTQQALPNPNGNAQQNPPKEGGSGLFKKFFGNGS